MNKEDQIQADDGQVICTRFATPIPMPNGETAPQTDGQMATVANIDQITKGDLDGQKLSSSLTLSGQRSLKEQVQECVARIQADVSTFKDTQLRLADDLFWLLDPAFDRFKEVYKTRKACISACTGKSRQWGYELVGLGKSRCLALKNGASEEELPDSIRSSKKWLSTHNDDGTPKPQSRSPVTFVIEYGIPIPTGVTTFIEIVLDNIRCLLLDETLSAARRIQLRDCLISCIDEICPPKSLPVKLSGKSNGKNTLRGP